MNVALQSLSSLKAQYQKLRRVGYTARDQCGNATVATLGRSGRQLTRKAGQKTVSTALNSEQYKSINEAVASQRKL